MGYHPGRSMPTPPERTNATPPLALPSGMRDILPPRSSHRRALARAALEAFERRGYDLVVPPVFEREDVVARGLGARASGDLVRLLDPDTGEVLVLRPDMTPQIARIVATRYRNVPAPFHLSYEGSVIRRPRGRARRHRQVSQTGVECIGRPSTDADVQVIEVIADALTAAGLTLDYRIELSHADIVDAAMSTVPDVLREAVTDAFALRDVSTWQRLLADFPDAAAKLATVASFAGDVTVLDRAMEVLTTPAFTRALTELRAVAQGLSEVGLAPRILVDLGEVRGIGYYTGVRFQMLAPGVSEPVASGGRYDDLLARYGVSLPATGGAIDLEALEEAIALRSGARREQGARWVFAGERAFRARRAADARNEAMTVAEVDTTDPAEVTAWARAHGYTRAWVCDARGVRELALGETSDGAGDYR